MMVYIVDIDKNQIVSLFCVVANQKQFEKDMIETYGDLWFYDEEDALECLLDSLF